MKLLGVTDDAIQEAARFTGVRAVGDAGALTLRPVDDTFRVWAESRGNGGQRRVSAVCWHGHLTFLAYLYADHPTMRVRSAFARFDGARDFEAKTVRVPANGYSSADYGHWADAHPGQWCEDASGQDPDAYDRMTMALGMLRETVTADNETEV